MIKRTVRDFVRDLCRAGRSDLQVKAVALVTRWGNEKEAVVSWLNRRGTKWRALGPLKKIEEIPQESNSEADREQKPSMGKVKLS